MNNLSSVEVAQLCLSSIEEVRPYLNRDVVIALKYLVAEESQSNPKRVLEMATVAIAVASLLDDELATSWATWSKATALLFAQRPREALPFYRQAEAIFSEYEQWLPLSRLQTGLIYIRSSTRRWSIGHGPRSFGFWCKESHRFSLAG